MAPLPPLPTEHEVHLIFVPRIDDDAMARLHASLIVNVASGVLMGCVLGAVAGRIVYGITHIGRRKR